MEKEIKKMGTSRKNFGFSDVLTEKMWED